MNIFSGKHLIVVLICAAAIAAILAVPVLWDRFTAAFSQKASKVAPKTFLAGLGILVGGMALHTGLLVMAGACMMGVVVILAILDNY